MCRGKAEQAGQGRARQGVCVGCLHGGEGGGGLSTCTPISFLPSPLVLFCVCMMVGGGLTRGG